MRIAVFLPLVVATQLSGQSPDSTRLIAIERFLQRKAAADSFSGVVLIARGGNPIFQYAAGLANRSFQVPNRIDTKFYLASMTKMFTGVAVARLAEQGKLRFSDAINKYVPEVPKAWGDRITIHHLLTHTSGLGTIWKPEYQRANHGLFRDVRDYFPLFISDAPAFTPGERWAYSNAGYVLLGAVIEKVTGQSYREYIREAVFRRAQMPGSMVDDVELPVPNRAVPYTRSNWTIPGATGLTSSESIGLSSMMPAGGAVANAPDLLNFANAIMSNRLLSPEYTELVTRGKVTYRPGASYGYGIANEVVNGIRIIFHDGGADGIATNLDIIPELGLTVIVLSNYDPGLAQQVAGYMRRILLDR